MKRAEVWQEGGEWLWLTYDPALNPEHVERRGKKRLNDTLPPAIQGISGGADTHAAALAHALAEVGLATAPDHREAP